MISAFSAISVARCDCQAGRASGRRTRPSSQELGRAWISRRGMCVFQTPAGSVASLQGLTCPEGHSCDTETQRNREEKVGSGACTFGFCDFSASLRLCVASAIVGRRRSPVLLPKSWLENIRSCGDRIGAFIAWSQRQYDKRAAFPKENRPCRMAPGRRSGRSLPARRDCPVLQPDKGNIPMPAVGLKALNATLLGAKTMYSTTNSFG
jgi:hypothetical protein